MKSLDTKREAKKQNILIKIRAKMTIQRAIKMYADLNITLKKIEFDPEGMERGPDCFFWQMQTNYDLGGSFTFNGSENDMINKAVLDCYDHGIYRGYDYD
jgi:hypothetical protein